MKYEFKDLIYNNEKIYSSTTTSDLLLLPGDKITIKAINEENEENDKVLINIKLQGSRETIPVSLSFV